MSNRYETSAATNSASSVLAAEDCRSSDIRSAEGFFEIGVGASRRRDSAEARIYLTLAAMLFRRGGDVKRAEKADVLAKSQSD